MIIRFRIWREQRIARIASKHSDQYVVAYIGQVRVGRYRNGRRVDR